MTEFDAGRELAMLDKLEHAGLVRRASDFFMEQGLSTPEMRARQLKPLFDSRWETLFPRATRAKFRDVWAKTYGMLEL